MEGHCPSCRRRLELPASGGYNCPSCGTSFEVRLGFPRPVFGGLPATFPPLPGIAGPGLPAAAPRTLDPSVQAPCPTHPANVSEFVCERCGDFMCRLCATPTEGRLYCPRCFDLLYSRGALQFAQRQFTLPSLTFGLGLGSFALSLIGCLCLPLLATVPLSIASIWSGMRALKEYRERPELPNRGLTISGIVFASLGLLASIGWVVFWAATIARNP